MARRYSHRPLFPNPVVSFFLFWLGYILNGSTLPPSVTFCTARYDRSLRIPSSVRIPPPYRSALGGLAMYTTFQKLAAEFIGTFALVFFGVGSICVDRHLQSSGGIGLLAIALAHGLAIAIMVSAFGHVSGGHFNPAVSIGFWVTKRIGTLDAFLYWAAQILGGIAAAFLLRSVIPEETWRAVSLGTPALLRDFPVVSAMILEAVTSFFLVLVVFATAVDERGAFRSIAGFGIGLTITLGILAIG